MRAVFEAAQGGKKLKWQKRVGEFLAAGYKPTDDDLWALAYYFKYERRGRTPDWKNPVKKIVRKIRDMCRDERKRGKKLTHAHAFEVLKAFAEVHGFTPEQLEDLEVKIFQELDRAQPKRGRKQTKPSKK